MRREQGVSNTLACMREHRQCSGGFYVRVELNSGKVDG